MRFYMKFQFFFSKICLHVCIWSIVDTPSLNPHWYCPIILFTYGFILPYSTIDSSLYAVLTSEIPLEFTQFGHHLSYAWGRLKLPPSVMESFLHSKFKLLAHKFCVPYIYIPPSIFHWVFHLGLGPCCFLTYQLHIYQITVYKLIQRYAHVTVKKFLYVQTTFEHISVLSIMVSIIRDVQLYAPQHRYSKPSCHAHRHSLRPHELTDVQHSWSCTELWKWSE